MKGLLKEEKDPDLHPSIIAPGSTTVAAHQLQRIGYGCELDPAYLAVQLERLSMRGLDPKLSNQ